MKRLLALLAAMFALGTSADATVLIYVGFTKIIERPDAPRPSRYRTFVFYDPDARRIGTISTWRVGTQKFLSVPTSSVLDANITTLPDGRTEAVLSTALHLDLGGGSFTNGATIYRGTRIALKAFGNGATVTAPRVFSGTTLAAALSNGGTDSSFSEIRITATYSAARSIKANDANQTFADARAALAAELTALGYQ